MLINLDINTANTLICYWNRGNMPSWAIEDDMTELPPLQDKEDLEGFNAMMNIVYNNNDKERNNFERIVINALIGT